MIEVAQLTKHFELSKAQRREMHTEAKQVSALKDVSFTCHPGRVFALLGPNGAGKTTLLRILATILKPSEGNARVAGFDTATQGREVRRRIGFLTGSTGLYHRLTPNELVKYFADLYGVEKRLFNQRKEALFTLLDVHDFARKRIGHLSTGMKQKVSIVRTLIHDPEVVILDEPTSGLDVITAAHIIELVNQLKSEGKTLIFSSHIMSEVELLCDDLAIIHKGQLCFNDTLEAFRTNMHTASLTKAFIQTIEEAQYQG